MLTHSLDYEAEQMAHREPTNHPTNPVSLGHAFSGINCWALVVLGALLLPRAPKPRPHQRRVSWALGLGLGHGEASAGCVFQEFHAKVPMSRSSGRVACLSAPGADEPSRHRHWCERGAAGARPAGRSGREAGHRELPSPSARATGPRQRRELTEESLEAHRVLSEWEFPLLTAGARARHFTFAVVAVGAAVGYSLCSLDHAQDRALSLSLSLTLSRTRVRTTRARDLFLCLLVRVACSRSRARSRSSIACVALARVHQQ